MPPATSSTSLLPIPRSRNSGMTPRISRLWTLSNSETFGSAWARSSSRFTVYYRIFVSTSVSSWTKTCTSSSHHLFNTFDMRFRNVIHPLVHGSPLFLDTIEFAKSVSTHSYRIDTYLCPLPRDVQALKPTILPSHSEPGANTEHTLANSIPPPSDS